MTSQSKKAIAVTIFGGSVVSVFSLSIGPQFSLVNEVNIAPQELTDDPVVVRILQDNLRDIGAMHDGME